MRAMGERALKSQFDTQKGGPMTLAEVHPERILVTVPEAAARLGIGRTTLYGLMASGAITPVHIGRLTRLTLDELESFVGVLITKASEGMR